MEYCTRILLTPPHVFVDYHGHSRRKNVFLFGCSKSGSWSAADRAQSDEPMQYLVKHFLIITKFLSKFEILTEQFCLQLLPHLMQKTSPAFALPLCSFKVERHKESTARVAVWRQLGVSRLVLFSILLFTLFIYLFLLHTIGVYLIFSFLCAVRLKM